jgi:predicted transcriptional regulator
MPGHRLRSSVRELIFRLYFCNECTETDAFAAAVREGIVDAAAGRTISYEKIRRWLLSWGTDGELPPPKSISLPILASQIRR